MLVLYFFLFNFLLALLIAKPIILLLQKFKSIQSFREKGPQSHIETKAGTPTLGGLIFLLPFFLSMGYLYLQSQDSRIVLVAFAFAVGFGLGFIDDILKIIQKNHKGIDSKLKLLIQLIAVIVIVYLLNSAAPYWEYIWAFLVIAGSSNAINLTDGLDGLGASTSLFAFLFIGILLLSFGDLNFYLLAISIVATLLAFLFFNKHPAQIFMGDTGSLSLGMGLGALAYINNLECYLLIFALVPVLETLSVIFQVSSAVISRKLFNKDWRPFKMAPLHHHFELSGMKECYVVRSFCFFQLLISALFLSFRESILVFFASFL